MRHLVRHTAEKEALGACHALVADDDQVGALLLGDVEDGIRRVALAREGLHLHTRLVDLFGRGVERGLHVLARIDRPLEVFRRTLPLAAQTTLRYRLVGADDVQRSTDTLGELGGLPNRLLGSVGAVRTYHD